MRRRAPVLVCVLLLVAGACWAAPAAGQSDVEETRLEAQLQADGDARWTIVATVPLENERQVEHFRSFADAFEGGQLDFRLGTDTFRRAAAESSDASDREMSIHSEEREAAMVNETEDGEVVSRYGQLRVSFTWDSFARVGDDRTIYVDDAFNTTDGTWLNGIDEGQTLVIRSPPGYGGPSTSPIGAEDGDLRWEGPETFEPGYFEIVYPPTQSSNGSFPTMLLGGAVGLSGTALLLGLYLLWRRDTGWLKRDPGAGPGPGEAPAGAVETAEEGAAESPSGANGQAAGAGAAAGAGVGAGTDAPTEDEEPDLELLSDEERVEYLLEQNGGRMKQANIVKETGWSNAKVSQLLSSMEDEERIDKLRIGRENLISLPGENVGDIAPEPDDDGGR